jgi:transcriptional repressor NrdR
MRTSISSSEIGNMVMDKLRDIDQVAYIRFASVYQDFSDVAGFINAISELGE